MKKYLFIFFSTAAFCVCFIFPKHTEAKSVTASDSALTVVAATAADTTQKLKERIDNVLKNRTDQVKGVIDEITLRKRAVVGEVERVIENRITVKNTRGTQVFAVTPEVIVLKDGRKASIDDAAVGDWITLLGYTEKQDFILKRVMISSTPLSPQFSDTFIGTLQTISKTQATFLPRNEQTPVTYIMNKSTQYEDSQGNPLSLNDIKTDNEYLLIAQTIKSNKTAVVLHALGSIQASPTPDDSNAP